MYTIVCVYIKLYICIYIISLNFFVRIGQGKGLNNNNFGLSSRRGSVALRNKYASDNFYKRKTHFSTFCVGKTQFFPTMSFFSVGLLYCSHTTLHFWHLWSPNVWRFFSPHIKEFSLTPVDVLKFNSVLTLSNTRETKSAAQGSVPQDPLPHFRRKSWAPCYQLCFWPTGCGS